MKYQVGFIIILLLGIQGCAETEEQVRVPARELYHGAFIAYEDELYQEAADGFTKLTEEHPGTRLATIAYLKIGDLNFQRHKWNEAESGYRMFLTLNPNSHLTPYVLNRLIALNYNRNMSGLFFRERSYDRDMEPNRKIIQDYQRFFLLYPQNAYRADVHEYLLKAREDLAEYEFLVGNFYFENQSYDSSILRYLYLLRHFPEYPKAQEVASILVDAYFKNHQPQLAKEMEKVLRFHLEYEKAKKTNKTSVESKS